MKSLTLSCLSFCMFCLIVQAEMPMLFSQDIPVLDFVVHAGNYTRENTPVSVTLDGLAGDFTAENLQLFEIRDNQRISQAFQLQMDDPLQISWILSGKTPAGTSRKYSLVKTSENTQKFEPEVLVSRTNGHLQIGIAEKKVLNYAYKAVPLPKGVSELYTRDGFIHPLWSPKGEILTRIQPPDHYHHYGIWNPWTHTEFEGREVDFWNLYKAQGTVRAKAVSSVVSGPVFGEFSALHDHIDLGAADPEGRQTALYETWRVRVWNADPQNNRWLIDFASQLNPATDSVFTIKAYRYQGFGFRATEKWDDQNATLLTSEGKDKSTGNATRARWCDVNGMSDFGTSGILFMTHPHNYNFPEQLRIWPTGSNQGKENVFFNFNPAQEQDWVLKPGKAYSLKYRMLVYDGKISPEKANRYWQDFAYPPRVEILAMSKAREKKVLVYTRNGKGYVHDNISASVAAIQKLGIENGFEVDVSDNPTVMTEDNLKQYGALIFSNSNNEAFETEDQRRAFQQYIQHGGGFVGIHSASGSERQWPWFSKMLGGKFLRHPPLQEFDIHILDPDHPSTSFLPGVWKWEDECYYLTHLNPDIHVLLAADLNTVEDEKKMDYPGDTFGDYFPLSWYHEFDGGRQWYTALGHKSEYYANPDFLRHLLGGILWVLDHE